jgi:hypothetical protein
MARDRQKASAPTQERFAEPRAAATPAADLTPERMLDLIQRRDGRDPVATGVVEDISPDGIAMVVLSGESRARAASTLLRFASATAASEALLGRTVLVLAPPVGPPVILGVVAQRLWEQRDAEQEVEARLPDPDEARTVQLDRKRLDLEASDEIRLTCGKSSLVLRRDGSVVIRGVTITSRATQTNKIRGGTVAIN